MEQVLALDIGGTKLEAGLVDVAGGVVWSARCPTPGSADARALWSALTGLLGAVPAGAAPLGCGVGCGGPMLRGGERVSPLNIPAWRDFPLRSELARHTSLLTWVDNDAKALALAEGWTGAAVGKSNYLSMVVSTGVGGGLVVDGRLVDGEAGNAGHVGHITVVPDGRPCRCGARGCLEAEASGLAIAGFTGAAPARAAPDVVERTGRLVGQGVASVANLLDLRLATVAGSVALGFGRPFFSAAQAELDSRARLEYSAGCRIMPSALGSRGPLVGAGALALRGLGRLGAPE
ncbi:MAG: ROK family protein [Acidimicrobiales bacterium]